MFFGPANNRDIVYVYTKAGGIITQLGGTFLFSKNSIIPRTKGSGNCQNCFVTEKKRPRPTHGDRFNARIQETIRINLTITSSVRVKHGCSINPTRFPLCTSEGVIQSKIMGELGDGKVIEGVIDISLNAPTFPGPQIF
jgi:hypothetical protein